VADAREKAKTLKHGRGRRGGLVVAIVIGAIWLGIAVMIIVFAV
jgi:hypothetical protein